MQLQAAAEEHSARREVNSEVRGVNQQLAEERAQQEAAAALAAQAEREAELAATLESPWLNEDPSLGGWRPG